MMDHVSPTPFRCPYCGLMILADYQDDATYMYHPYQDWRGRMRISTLPITVHEMAQAKAKGSDTMLHIFPLVSDWCNAIHELQDDLLLRARLKAVATRTTELEH